MWSLVRSVPVEGARAAGFVPGAPLLLVVGEPGRGEIELSHGILVARDPSPDGGWFDVSAPAALSVSSPGVWVPLALPGSPVLPGGPWCLDLSSSGLRVASGPEVLRVDGPVLSAAVSPDGRHLAALRPGEVLLYRLRSS